MPARAAEGASGDRAGATTTRAEAGDDGAAPGGGSSEHASATEASATPSAWHGGRKARSTVGPLYHGLDLPAESGMLRGMRIPRGAFRLLREAARHLLRRPVVGVAAAARTKDGRWLLIRRGDTGEWALPGGTLEWGETLAHALERELLEETGARLEQAEGLSGVYSRSDRDPRFHAVTVVVRARVSEPEGPPVNPVEIREVRLFADDSLPPDIGMGMADMIRDARSGGVHWE